MKRTADAVVIGAGIIGSATAYYLARQGLKVLLLDRGFPCTGSTGRCIGGIRQQFTHDLTVRLMIENVTLFQGLSEEVGRDIEWFQGGYLMLAHNVERQRTYEQAIAIQRTYGIDVRFVPADTCATIVPGLSRDSLLGGAHCPTDGQANPFYTTYGFIDRMKELGGKLLDYTEVTGFRTTGTRIAAVLTAKGEEIVTPRIIAATGPRLADVAGLLGLKVPVEAERHESLVTEAVDRLFDPMLVDYRADGCYFVQNYGTGHFIGCYTPVPNIPGHDVSASDEFATEMPRRMVRLVPRLADVRVIRQWAGSYEMTPDGNPIVGPTSVEGFYLAGGMCGHGFMLGPAIGLHLAELVTAGRSSVDLGEFYLDRAFGKAEALK